MEAGRALDSMLLSVWKRQQVQVGLGGGGVKGVAMKGGWGGGGGRFKQESTLKKKSSVIDYFAGKVSQITRPFYCTKN